MALCNYDTEETACTSPPPPLTLSLAVSLYFNYSEFCQPSPGQEAVCRMRGQMQDAVMLMGARALYLISVVILADLLCVYVLTGTDWLAIS